jgi:DNA-binding MarR family transcriptional regulator
VGGDGTNATRDGSSGTTGTAITDEGGPTRTDAAEAAAVGDDDGGSDDGAADGGGRVDDGPGSGSDDGTGMTPPPVGPSVAAGVGVVTAAALARRLLLSGSSGAAGPATTAAATTASTASTAASSTASGMIAPLTDRLDTLRRTLSDWWWRVAGAGYAKWAGDEPLAHDTRGALYEHVQANPGTYLSAFEDEVEVDATFGTIRYHLKILEREGLVVSEKVNAKRRYYPVGTSPNALQIALESDATRSVLEALAEDPDSVTGLADRIDRHPSTVTHHLDRLEEDGLVERERDGRAVTARLTPGARRMLVDENGAEAAADGAARAD